MLDWVEHRLKKSDCAIRGTLGVNLKCQPSRGIGLWYSLRRREWICGDDDLDADERVQNVALDEVVIGSQFQFNNQVSAAPELQKSQRVHRDPEIKFLDATEREILVEWDC